MCMLSRVQFFLTSWTVARQAPLSMELSRQEFWSGLPFPSPEDLPNPGTEPSLLCLLHWEAGSLALHHLGSPHTTWVDLKAFLSPLEAVHADSTAIPRLVRLAHGDRNLKGGPG